ncbi:MAG: hypothetical protein AAF483_01655 [Planctomycetota bacterium]
MKTLLLVGTLLIASTYAEMASAQCCRSARRSQSYSSYRTYSPLQQHVGYGSPTRIYHQPPTQSWYQPSYPQPPSQNWSSKEHQVRQQPQSNQSTSSSQVNQGGNRNANGAGGSSSGWNTTWRTIPRETIRNGASNNGFAQQHGSGNSGSLFSTPRSSTSTVKMQRIMPDGSVRTFTRNR